jgi:hypothetical protein
LLLVVVGIAFGTFLGCLGNWALFHRMADNKRKGLEPLRGIGTIFFIRYTLDAVFLFAFGYIVKDTWAIIAAAMSLTVAVKVSLFIVYSRKGGRFN